MDLDAMRGDDTMVDGTKRWLREQDRCGIYLVSSAFNEHCLVKRPGGRSKDYDNRLDHFVQRVPEWSVDIITRPQAGKRKVNTESSHYLKNHKIRTIRAQVRSTYIVFSICSANIFASSAISSSLLAFRPDSSTVGNFGLLPLFTISLKCPPTSPSSPSSIR